MCESGGLHTSYPREAKRRLSVRYSSKIPQGGPLQLEPGGGYFIGMAIRAWPAGPARKLAEKTRGGPGY